MTTSPVRTDVKNVGAMVTKKPDVLVAVITQGDLLIQKNIRDKNPMLSEADIRILITFMANENKTTVIV